MKDLITLADLTADQVGGLLDRAVQVKAEPSAYRGALAGSTLALLFDQPKGSGHYYGSDALRSPLDHYRAPGSPEYTDT